jgi:hypothetical protein
MFLGVAPIDGRSRAGQAAGAEAEQVFPGRRDDAVPRISLCCRSRPALSVSVSGVASVLGQARMAEWLPLQRPSSPRVENSEE